MGWETWLLDKLGGGLFSGLVSAPLSFAITKGLQAAFPSEEARNLQDIQATVHRMEGTIAKGFDDVQTKVTVLEKHLDTQFKGLLAAIPEQFATTYVENINFWYSRISKNKDLDELPGVRSKIEEDIDTICHVLVGGPGTGQEKGLLMSWVEHLSSRFTGAPADGAALLSFYLLLETRVDRKLVQLMQGVAVCEYGYTKAGKEAESRSFRDDFIHDNLNKLFAEFFFQVEALVLAYVSSRKLDLNGKSGSTHRNLGSVVPYIFKRCDLFTFGVLAVFTQRHPAGNWITGRVIGTEMDIAQGLARSNTLAALALPGNDDVFLPFARTEVVKHDMQAVSFIAADLFHPGSRELMAADQSPLQVLRYRLAGLPDTLLSPSDEGGLTTPGSMVQSLRGEPPIEQLGLLSVWDKAFLPAQEKPPADAPPWRHRSEFVFGWPFAMGSVALREVDAKAPFNQRALYGAVWQAQLLRSAQQLWNRRHVQIDEKDTRGGAHPISVVGLAPNGQWWATDAWDNALELRNVADGKVIRRLPVQTGSGHTAPIQALAIGEDSLRLVTGSLDGTLKLWNAADGSLVRMINAQGGVRSVALATSRRLLASGGQDGHVRLWSLDDGRLLHDLSGHARPVVAAGLSADGAWLATASVDACFVWDTATGQKRFSLPGARTATVWKAGNQHLCALALVGMGRQIAIVDLAGGKTVQSLKLPADHGQVAAFAIAPDGHTAASSCSSTPYTIVLWDLNRGVPARMLPGHSNSVHALAFNRAGDKLYSGSHDHSAKVWQWATGQAVETLTVPSPHEDQAEADARVLRMQLNASSDFLQRGTADAIFVLRADNGLYLDFAHPTGAVVAGKVATDAACQVHARIGDGKEKGKLNLLAADGKPLGRNGADGPLAKLAQASDATQFTLEVAGGGLVALKADNNKYLVRWPDNVIRAIGPDAASHALFLPSTPQAEGAPYFVWEDGARLDVTRHVTCALSLSFWHSGGWPAGGSAQTWYAPLFTYNGPAAELDVGVRVERTMHGYGFDLAYALEYSFVCAQENGKLSELEAKGSKNLVSVSLFQDSAANKPGSSYDDWRDWTAEALKNEGYAHAVLKLQPGSRVWLKTTGSVSYPKNKFFGNRPHNNMNADLFLRLQDIVLRWREPPPEGADEKA